MKVLVTSSLVALLAVAGSASQAQSHFKACLTGAQEVADPDVVTNARGSLDIRFDTGLTLASVVLRVQNLDNFLGAA